MKKITLKSLFNSLFIIFFEGYMEIGISCYLNFKNAIVITSSDLFSYYFAYILGLICLTVIPGLIIFIMTKDETFLNHKDTKEGFFSNIYDNLKTNSIMSLSYNFLYIIRRIIFITIIFNPWLQKDQCV